MEYKGCHGKTVVVKTDKDLDGNRINNKLPHVVTFYLDSEDEIVGIHPLEPDGLNKDEVLSIQSYKHEVVTEDLEPVEVDGVHMTNLYMIGNHIFTASNVEEALFTAKKKMLEMGWRNLRLMKKDVDGWNVCEIIPSFER